MTLSVYRYTVCTNTSFTQMSGLTQIRAQPQLLSATPYRRVYLETCHKSRAFGEAGVGLVLVQEVSPAPMIICGLVSARLPTKRVQSTTGWLQLWPHSLQITQGLLFCRRKCLYNIKLFSRIYLWMFWETALIFKKGVTLKKNNICVRWAREGGKHKTQKPNWFAGKKKKA